MSSVTSLFARAVARWHLPVLFTLAFGLSLWWSVTGTERPTETVFTPPTPALVKARSPLGEVLARPSDTGAHGIGIAATAPVSPAAPSAEPLQQHADGDNAPGIGLEPEPEPAPE